MKLKIFLITLVVTTVSLQINSLNFLTTAESVSWNGAYTSVADSFEAMLYNPAGIYMTEKKWGLNAFGSSGIRVYNNTLSTSDLLKVFNLMKTNNGDITDFVKTKMSLMPDLNGFDLGFDLSMFNFMFFYKTKDYGFSFSFLPKTYITASLSKSIFQTVFDKLDVEKGINAKISATAMQYFDLNFSLSTRVRFLEKAMPFFNAIYAGVTGHVYIPTFFANVVGEGSVYKGSPNADGIYSYRLKLNPKMIFSGIAPNFFTLIPNSPIPFQSGTGGVGFGFDMGFILEFNRFVKVGFSITDLGFFALSANQIETAVDLDIMDVQNISTNLLNSFKNTKSQLISYGWMPATSFRLGVLVTPVKHKYFDLLIAGDISVTDLQRAINGEYATFNVSTGVEFTPKTGNNKLKFPLRLAFNYNTQANAPSFSWGFGLHAGPVEMEVAIRGLEVLISGWGAKEIAIAYDFKFEFDK
ncbi:MAG: hypothetical protein A2086_13000 [Spirochaetes bacterium GWD1_27_9]|nr:MAG: hypothetical protein A2Z98_13465 [Spirochaetes bacterium GWB1_27_13]OHD23922.1 MAG: hypothetical protein A2Y34_18660 [Spirochaetes bacterium GWC1_27_15]OHD43579.1 MAG: hypothetical protein A2086_13000 [Spirochaetes bacterium GWD1_27_9]